MSIAYQWKLKEKEAAEMAKTGTVARGKTEAAAKDTSSAVSVDESTQRVNVLDKPNKQGGPTGLGQMSQGTMIGKQGSIKPEAPSFQGTALGKQSPSKPEVLPAQGIGFGKQSSSKPEVLPAPGTALWKQGSSKTEVLTAQGTGFGKQSSSKPEVLPTPGTVLGKQGSSRLPVGKDNLKSLQTKEADSVPAPVAGSPTKDGRLLPGGAATSKIPVGAKENVTNTGVRKPVGSFSKKEEPASSIKSKTPDESNSKTVAGKKEPAAAAATKDAVGVTADEGPFGSGRTKGLAGFWANQNDEVKVVKKKRLTAVEENLPPMIVESKPQQLEGVVRAEDTGEWKKPLQLEQGSTKNVVSSFQKRQQEPFTKKNLVTPVENSSIDKTEIPVKVKDLSHRLVRQQNEPLNTPKEKVFLDLSQNAVVLAENQPMEVDPNVVRSEDAAKEEVVLEKGRTRNLLQHWKNTEVEYNTPKTSTTRYQGAKPAWILEIEAAKGNTAEKNEDGEPIENEDINQPMADEAKLSQTSAELQERTSEIAKSEFVKDSKQISHENASGSVSIPRQKENEEKVETTEITTREQPVLQEWKNEENPNKVTSTQISLKSQQDTLDVLSEISASNLNSNPDSGKEIEDKARLMKVEPEISTSNQEVPVTEPIEAASVQVNLENKPENSSVEAKLNQNELTQQVPFDLTESRSMDVELRPDQEIPVDLHKVSTDDEQQLAICAEAKQMLVEAMKQTILVENDEGYADAAQIHDITLSRKSEGGDAPAHKINTEIETSIGFSAEEVKVSIDSNLANNEPQSAEVPKLLSDVGEEINKKQVERVSSVEEFYDTQSSPGVGTFSEKSSDVLTERAGVISPQDASTGDELIISSQGITNNTLDISSTLDSTRKDAELIAVDSGNTGNVKSEKPQLTLDDLLRIDSSSLELITDETPCLVPSTPESLSAPYTQEIDSSTEVSSKSESPPSATNYEHMVGRTSHDSNLDHPSKEDGKESVKSNDEQNQKSEPSQRSCLVM